MKEPIANNKRKPGHVRRRPGRVAALIAALAVCACTAVPLQAVVIDDFENGVKFIKGGGGTNEFIWGLTNGQLIVYTNAPSLGHRYDNVGWLKCLPGGSLEGGRTLELRMDLNHTSADDLFLLLMCGGRNAGADSVYGVFVDRNEVALAKYRSHFTTFYWDTLTTTNENVTVKLALTKTNSSVAVTVKIVDKGNQRATLYERTFLDGPGQDGPSTPPDPHGMGVFTPDEGAPLTNFTYAAAGCWGVVSTYVPRLELLLDNVEYDVYHPPHLEIARATNGVDLTWQLPLEEQIVVQATNLAGPWCPCPQPCTRTTNDLFCLTLPCDSPQQFFKLTPGLQFTDDFSSAVPSWTSWFYDPPEDQWIVTNGVLQVSLSEEHDTNSFGGLALCPLGIQTNVEAVLEDFCASVDILDWVTSGTNWSSVLLFGRGIIHSDWGEGYFGGLVLNYKGIPGLVEPSLAGPAGSLHGETFCLHEFPPPYRLQCSMVGTKASFRVLRVATGQLIRQLNFDVSSTPDPILTNGIVGLWFRGRTDEHDSYTTTVDNFFLSGTK